MNVTLGAGNDTVTISNLSGTVAVTIDGVENVVSGASTTSNTVILANDSTVVNVTGGAGVLNINANNALTAANTFTFGAAADSLTVSSLLTVSNAASIDGGSGGVDTLIMSAATNGASDGAFRNISNFDVFQLSGNATTNNVTIGTEFMLAGFDTITGSVSNDYVIASGDTTDVTGLTFNGGAGSADTFTFQNTASGTIIVNAVEAVTQGDAAGAATQAVAIHGDAALTIGIDLGAGAGDTVTNLNTNAVTVTLTGVESYYGSFGTDSITLGSAGAITVNALGTDSVTLAVNTSGLTAIAGGGSAISVIGNVGTFVDSIVVNGAGTYFTTNVETLTVGANADGATINAFLFSNAVTGVTGNGTVTLASYDLADNTDATFTFNNVTTGLTGGAVYLTVDASTAQDANITFAASTLKLTQTGAAVISTGDIGTTTITLDAGGATGTSTEVIQTNLGGLEDGVLITDSITVSGFKGADSVDLTGITLVDAAGGLDVMYQSYLDASGLTLGNTFDLNTTFITGNSTTLANLTSGPNDEGVIFQFGMGATTADFSTQAGIDFAVNYIVNNIGTTTSGSQVAVLAVNSGASDNSNALFLFTDDGTSGIDAGDLKLIGVVSGTLSSATFS